MRKSYVSLIIAALILLLVPFNVLQADTSINSFISTGNGFAGQTVEYKLQLLNSDTIAHFYSLSAVNLPANYKYSFYKDAFLIKNKLEIKPGQVVDILLKVKIPNDFNKDNRFYFSIEDVRDDAVITSIPLSLSIDNSYNLETSSSLENLQVLSGKEIEFSMDVKNNGQKDLSNVALNVDLPYKWQAAVSPQKLDKLAAGQSSSFHIKLFVPATQDSGNKTINVTAKSDQIVAVAKNIPIVVQKGSSYIIIPIIIVVFVFASVVLYFKKRGRR